MDEIDSFSVETLAAPVSHVDPINTIYSYSQMLPWMADFNPSSYLENSYQSERVV